MTDESIDGVDVYTLGNNFTYDKAGRLLSARVPGHTLTYGFGATACPLSPEAGGNTNRTSLTDNQVTTTYCYDQADKLLSTTDPRYPSIGYDSHQNTTTLGGGPCTAARNQVECCTPKRRVVEAKSSQGGALLAKDGFLDRGLRDASGSPDFLAASLAGCYSSGDPLRAGPARPGRRRPQ